MVRIRVWSAIVAVLLWWFALQMPVKAAETVYSLPSIRSFTNPAETPPMNPVGQASTVEMTRIRSGLLPGVVIGGRYDGILRILQEPYTATGQLDERLEDAARSLIEDELSQAGYEVVRSPFNSVFADQLMEEPEPGRFLLGGTITSVKRNSYTSLFGSQTHDQRTIRWEVFDREVGKVVYRQETTGAAQAEGVDNLAATYEAIRASLKVLLAEPTFTAALMQPTTVGLPIIPASYEIQAIASTNQPLTVEQLVGRSIPSVVQVRTPGARGTGFLIDPSGLIVTNQHVVGSSFSVKVGLYDGSTRSGRVLKRDANYDVALIQLDDEAGDMAGLPICHTNAVKVGEAVVAIGNPLSLSNTVTQGVVSGFRHDASRNLIQTDAAINPGNSGGPLLNRRGAVIGIVTEKMVSRGVEGLGFALPIGEALQLLNVRINTPMNSVVDPCGSPITTAFTGSGFSPLNTRDSLEAIHPME